MKNNKITTIVLLVCFCLTSLHASLYAALPPVAATPTILLLTDKFDPPVIKGLKVDPANPWRFNFIVDKGNGKSAVSSARQQAEEMLKYFLAALAIPEKEMWVNLSPDEPGRIISSSLERTPLGKVLLEQDYLLKQLASSLTHPDTEQGKAYWDEMNGVGANLCVRPNNPGQTRRSAPTNSLARVWIMPQSADVYEKDGEVFVSNLKLKVLTDADYRQMGTRPGPVPAFEKHILPLIEQEVNTGRHFSQLRQVTYTLILAAWFKAKQKESLLNRLYADKYKLKGIELNDPELRERVYQQYLKSCTQGVYDIRQKAKAVPAGRQGKSQNYSGAFGAVDKVTTRRYFSGGFDAATPKVVRENGEVLARSPSTIVRECARPGSLVPAQDDSKMVVEFRPVSDASPLASVEDVMRKGLSSQLRDLNLKEPSKNSFMDNLFLARLALTFQDSPSVERFLAAAIINIQAMVPEDDFDKRFNALNFLFDFYIEANRIQDACAVMDEFTNNLDTVIAHGDKKKINDTRERVDYGLMRGVEFLVRAGASGSELLPLAELISKSRSRHSAFMAILPALVGEVPNYQITFYWGSSKGLITTDREGEISEIYSERISAALKVAEKLLKSKDALGEDFISEAENLVRYLAPARTIDHYSKMAMIYQGVGNLSRARKYYGKALSALNIIDQADVLYYGKEIFDAALAVYGPASAIKLVGRMNNVENKLYALGRIAASVEGGKFTDALLRNLQDIFDFNDNFDIADMVQELRGSGKEGIADDILNWGMTIADRAVSGVVKDDNDLRTAAKIFAMAHDFERAMVHAMAISRVESRASTMADLAQIALRGGDDNSASRALGVMFLSLDRVQGISRLFTLAHGLGLCKDRLIKAKAIKLSSINIPDNGIEHIKDLLFLGGFASDELSSARMVGLLRDFLQRSNNNLEALELLARFSDKDNFYRALEVIGPYFYPNAPPLKDIVIACGKKLPINLYEVASVRAAKGLIEAMGLTTQEVIITYSDEISESEAQTYFPGFEVVEADHDKFLLGFVDSGANEVVDEDLQVPYSPFKYGLPKPVSKESVSLIRDQLSALNRKVIVVGSPSDKELATVMHQYNNAYGALPAKARPLLIVALRHRRDAAELSMLDVLAGQSTHVRDNPSEPFEDMSNANLLVLNTSGELLNVYALADLSIVGHDRNILEPVSQGSAVLFFDGEWPNNYEAKNSLVAAGGGKVFNEKNFMDIMNDSPAAAEMGRRGMGVIDDFKSRKIPLAAANVALVLAQHILCVNWIDKLAVNMPKADDGLGGIDLDTSKMKLTRHSTDARGMENAGVGGLKVIDGLTFSVISYGD